MVNPLQAESRLRRVVFCTDFSESADAAFDFALDATVRRPGATLYIVHVKHEADAQFWRSYLAEVDDVEEESRQIIDARIRDSYLSRVPPAVEVRVEVRDGPDAESILELAADLRADLIVIGRHGHGRVSKTLFGGVAEKIVRKAHCPVLVVPLDYAAQKGSAG